MPLAIIAKRLRSTLMNSQQSLVSFHYCPRPLTFSIFYTMRSWLLPAACAGAALLLLGLAQPSGVAQENQLLQYRNLRLTFVLAGGAPELRLGAAARSQLGSCLLGYCLVAVDSCLIPIHRVRSEL